MIPSKKKLIVSSDTFILTQQMLIVSKLIGERNKIEIVKKNKKIR